MGFPVVMYGCESWTVKKAECWRWCFWTVVLEKTLESPLDCKEIQPVHVEDQPWDFFGRNDVKAEVPVLWLPPAKSWLIGKDSDAGRDWGWEEKGMTEDEMTRFITDLMDVSLSELREMVMDREAWPSVIHGVAKSQTRLNNWTDWLTDIFWEFLGTTDSLVLNWTDSEQILCRWVQEIFFFFLEEPQIVLMINQV